MSIQYIFKSGRKNRLASKNKFPKEFFYGYFYLLKKGYDVHLIEEDDLGINKKTSFFYKIIDKFSIIVRNVSLRQFFSLLNKYNLKLLNDSEVLIVTTNSLGITLGLLQRLGFVKKPILFFVMGLIPLKASYVEKKIYSFILKNVQIVCISKNEKNYLEDIFRNKSIPYIPFGVDKDFWHPNPKKLLKKNYVLAIGNDNARDWETLIKSWENDFPELKLVTNLPVTSGKKNITVIKGSWGDKFLTDDEIMELYSNSLFVVIPLKETIQPSGQSCCLQAMACGKPVIISEIKGIWDDDLLIDRDNLLLVKPESISSLNNSIKELNNNKKLQDKLSYNARKLVEEKFNNEIMSKHIDSVIKNKFGKLF